MVQQTAVREKCPFCKQKHKKVHGPGASCYQILQLSIDTSLTPSVTVECLLITPCGAGGGSRPSSAGWRWLRSSLTSCHYRQAQASPCLARPPGATVEHHESTAHLQAQPRCPAAVVSSTRGSASHPRAAASQPSRCPPPGGISACRSSAPTACLPAAWVLMGPAAPSSLLSSCSVFLHSFTMML